MNKDQTDGKFDGFIARVKQQWGKLTDNEVKQAEGNIDELFASIQEKYGDSREAVAAKFNELKASFDKK